MLLPLTGAFLSGLVLGAYLPYLPASIFTLLLLTAVALTLLERRRRLTPALGISLFACLLGGLLWWIIGASEPRGPKILTGSHPQTMRVVGTIVEPVRHRPNRSVMMVSVATTTDEQGDRAAEGLVRVTWRDPSHTFAQGDTIAFTARLRPPAGTINPGGFDYGGYLRRKGVQAVASVSGARGQGQGQGIVLHDSGSQRTRWAFWHRLDGWREAIRTAATRSLEQPGLGIYLGVIIGEQGFLDQSLRDRFMATGTVHILSISGSHLGLIAFLTFFSVTAACRLLPATWLLHLSRRITPTRLAALLTMPPVTFYALLAGAEVATVRSLLMILVFLLAVWRGYAQHLLHALAAAALVILLHDPAAILDISFQLSFTSVLAIALVLRWRGTLDDCNVPNEPRLLERLTRWVRAYAWITGGVTIATLPLVAYHFNQIAWLGLLANLLVVPLAGFVVVPLGLLSAVALLVGGGTTLAFGTLNEAALTLMAGTVTSLARIPGAEWHVASPSIAAILCFYTCVLLLGGPNTAPGLRRGAAVGAACFLAWWAWSPRDLPERTLRVTFLDVGQGDATILELPEGEVVLIDAGAAYDRLDMGRAVVGPYLWDRGINRLDLVIGTHPQRDHVGGVPWILSRFDVDTYSGNGITRPHRFYQRLERALRTSQVVRRRVEAGDLLLATASCELLALNPPPSDGRARGGEPWSNGTRLNNHSVVVRLDCGPYGFLFPADIESQAMQPLSENGAPLHVQVVKVPHHGARSSLHEAWIHEVGAHIGIISAGRFNPYHHPAPAVMRAYEKAGTALRRTDRDGAVIVTATLSPANLRVRTAREMQLRPVRPGRAPFSVERRNAGLLWEQWVTGRLDRGARNDRT